MPQELFNNPATHQTKKITLIIVDIKPSSRKQNLSKKYNTITGHLDQCLRHLRTETAKHGVRKNV